MGTFNKHCDKGFFITQEKARKEKPSWTKDMKSSKCRLHVRMVVRNLACGMHECRAVDLVVGAAGSSSQNICQLVNLRVTLPVWRVGCQRIRNQSLSEAMRGSRTHLLTLVTNASLGTLMSSLLVSPWLFFFIHFCCRPCSLLMGA